MASSFQRAASRRKLIYFGIIAGLFAVTIFARGVIALPLSGLKDTVGKYTIRSQARELDLTEYEAVDQTEGTQREAELTGSAVRLLLTGSRGIAICGLWISANESQVKQEWNQLELTVKSITKLQPHFVTPWLFQSWNLAYNVSVEMDRINDMYFYIGRGITLLSEGEAVNRHNPDMRYALGFYYQNKFTVSDKVTTLRSLLQLSCMPVEDRNPEKYMTAGKIDDAKFKELCIKYPQFVRRLRESTIKYGRKKQGDIQIDLVMQLAPEKEQVLAFMRDNAKIPGRYQKEDTRALETRLKQFPVVPPLFQGSDQELSSTLDWSDAQATAVLAARSWFKYANEAAPPPNPVPAAADFSYRDPERKRRLPRQPMLIIFMQGPPRAQTYLADQLAKEGWFDGSDWVVDQDLTGKNRWFAKVSKDGRSEEFSVKPSSHSQQAWSDAYTMWFKHGRANGLELTAEELANYRSAARLYENRRGGFRSGVDPIPEPRPDERKDPNINKSFEACLAIRFYGENRKVTNYESFLEQAKAEMDDLTIQARKTIFQADRTKRNGDRKGAIELYEQVLGTQEEVEWSRNLKARQDYLAFLMQMVKQTLGTTAPLERPLDWKQNDERLLWYKVLNRYQKSAALERMQEETLEMQIRYLRAVMEGNRTELVEAALVIRDILRAGSYQFGPHALATSYQMLGSTRVIRVKIPVLGSVQWHLPLNLNLSTDEHTFIPALRRLEPIWPPGPFDGLNPETGKPWYLNHVREKVLGNLGMLKTPAGGSTPATPPGGGAPLPNPPARR